MNNPISTLNFTSCLGYGSFGIVVKSGNNNGLSSAVKIIFTDVSENKLSLTRECSILSGKEHKNIIQIQNVFVNYFNFEEIEKLGKIVMDEKIYDQLSLRKAIYLKSGVPLSAVCIQMELCEISLRDWLNKNAQHIEDDNSAFSDKNVIINQLQIIGDIISGLKYLHENKILHRDLKPENILFTSNPEPTWKIGDFGLSRFLHREESFTGTLTKDVGTPTYRAPELISSYDLRSDLYSLGLIIWEVSQLIHHSQRNNLFWDLVINKNHFVIKTQIVKGISKIILHLTKYDVNQRMKSIKELDMFSKKIEKNLKILPSIEKIEPLVKYSINNGNRIQINNSFFHKKQINFCRRQTMCYLLCLFITVVLAFLSVFLVILYIFYI